MSHHGEPHMVNNHGKKLSAIPDTSALIAGSVLNEVTGVQDFVSSVKVAFRCTGKCRRSI